MDLGLNPDEAVSLGLPTEVVSRKNGRRVPVGGKFKGTVWEKWLQTTRCELDALGVSDGTPDFIEWLDGKMQSAIEASQLVTRKVIPPLPVLAERMRQSLADEIRLRETERILRDAGIENIVRNKLIELLPVLTARAAELHGELADVLDRHPQDPWWRSVEVRAKDLVGNNAR